MNEFGLQRMVKVVGHVHKTFIVHKRNILAVVFPDQTKVNILQEQDWLALAF